MGRQTNAEIAVLKSRWERRKANYINCQHLEATLRNQLTAAFDYGILDSLRDKNTHTIAASILAIIQFFFEEYGDLSSDDLLLEEDSIKKITFTTLHCRSQQCLTKSLASRTCMN